MRLVALFLLVLGAMLGGASSIAGPAAPGPGRGGASPFHGGAFWGGAHPHAGVAFYRPAYGPGYGGRWVGYPGYGFGLGVGLGYGYGFGYGTGWALTGGYPWYYWGAPAYGGYPFGYGVTSVPALITNEDLVFVQPPPTDAAGPPPQQPSSGYWYYCTAPAGYFPYVEQCTRPWIAVQPQAGTPAR